MTSFSDASRWLKVVFLLNALGFAMFMYSMLFGISRHDEALTTTAVLTFFFYIVALCLAFSWTFVNEARSNKGVQISTIVFDFFAAVVAIAMLAILGIGHNLYYHNGCSMTTAALFALLAGIFAIVEISGEVNFKVIRIPSPRKGKKAKDAEAPAEENKDEVVELEETTEAGKDDAKPAEGAAAAAAPTEDASNGHVVKEEAKDETKEEEKEEGAEKKEEAKEEAKDETPKDEAAKE